MLKAEKAHVHADAEKRILAERVSELRKKLSEAAQSLKETEMQKRLFERESQSYKDEVVEMQKGMNIERLQLKECLARLQSEVKTTGERLQDIEEEKADLEARVADLQAEVSRSKSEREDEVMLLQQQLCDARMQQQTVEDEMRRLWKEITEKQQRCQCMEWDSLIHGACMLSICIYVL